MRIVRQDTPDPMKLRVVVLCVQQDSRQAPDRPVVPTVRLVVFPPRARLVVPYVAPVRIYPNQLTGWGTGQFVHSALRVKNLLLPLKKPRGRPRWILAPTAYPVNTVTRKETHVLIVQKGIHNT